LHYSKRVMSRISRMWFGFFLAFVFFSFSPIQSVYALTFINQPLEDSNNYDTSGTPINNSTQVLRLVENSNDYGAYIKWDLSALKGYCIDSGTLSLTGNTVPVVNYPLRGYRFLRDWTIAATGSTYDGINLWNASRGRGFGADISATPLFDVNNAPSNVINIALNNDELRKMVADNKGMNIWIPTGLYGYIRYGSMNDLNPNSRPKLVIQYSNCLTPMPTSIPTSTPTPTTTPTPTSPQPFLDLPWNYDCKHSTADLNAECEASGKKVTFNEAAFNPNSWFDHQYPLQNIPCCQQNVLIYTGLPKALFYRSHSGYDYGLMNGVRLGTPVLAAASGWAEFKSEEQSGGAGNMIKIDHGNGYQTWYEHLSKDGLIVNTQGQKVHVEKGQEIGKTNFTGNAYPKDERGAHIHFSVFKDVNNNGNFEDDYPYGLVDPLGWEGNYKDPWTEYGNGDIRGAESFNLFLAREKPKEQAIPKTGGELIVENKIKVSVPDGALPQMDFVIKFKDGPFESDGDLTSIVPSFFLDALSSIGDKITQFFKPVEITYDYSQANLLNINEDSLKLYSFNEQAKIWEALPSSLDKDTKTIKATTTHFSHFVLMGEVKDKVDPVTEIILNGDKGQEDWYRSDVAIDLLGNDNDGGVDVEYTLYQIDDQEWQEYTTPFVVDVEGEHIINYFSIDKAENKEKTRTKKFYIDRTSPQVTIDVNPKMLWPANGKMVDISITGSSSDVNISNTIFSVEDEYNLVEPEIRSFNQTIKLQAKRDGYDMDGRNYIISAIITDKAGNKTIASKIVIVPHDQSK
jgi:hypothetical protein